MPLLFLHETVHLAFQPQTLLGFSSNLNFESGSSMECRLECPSLTNQVPVDRKRWPFPLVPQCKDCIAPHPPNHQHISHAFLDPRPGTILQLLCCPCPTITWVASA